MCEVVNFQPIIVTKWRQTNYPVGKSIDRRVFFKGTQTGLKGPPDDQLLPRPRAPADFAEDA